MKSFDCKQCAASARQGQTLTKFFSKLSRRGKERSDIATVKSHRMASARFPTIDSTWDYLVTFTLSDGNEVELFAPKDLFDSIRDGEIAMLRWEGETILSFEQE